MKPLVSCSKCMEKYEKLKKTPPCRTRERCMEGEDVRIRNE